MFDLLLFNLRSQSVKVGVGEWLVFLKGIRQGLVVDLDGLYHFGRSILVQSEAQFDAWDIAFDATFAGVELPPMGVVAEMDTEQLHELWATINASQQSNDAPTTPAPPFAAALLQEDRLDDEAALPCAPGGGRRCPTR